VAQAQRTEGDYRFLPQYARGQNYKSLKQSSSIAPAAMPTDGRSRPAARRKFSIPPDPA